MSENETEAAGIANSKEKRPVATINFHQSANGLVNLDLVSDGPSRVAAGSGHRKLRCPQRGSPSPPGCELSSKKPHFLLFRNTVFLVCSLHCLTD